MPMSSDSKLRWATNGPPMYCHIRRGRVALCTALEADIRIPGAEANKAMQVFLSAVESWPTPRGHSLTSILMEGLGFERESAAAADVDRLVIVSVIRWNDLQELANETKANGKYNRSLCKGVKDIRDLPGYKKFDPSTAEGSRRWVQLRAVFEAYFR